MVKFWAVMLDETGCEFGVGVEAETREDAYNQLEEDWCESRCVQLESPEDTTRREQAMYDRINRELDGYGDDDYDLEDDE
jgi:hypothetical protein